jgi:hypothetical protein
MEVVNINQILYFFPLSTWEMETNGREAKNFGCG